MIHSDKVSVCIILPSVDMHELSGFEYAMCTVQSVIVVLKLKPQIHYKVGLRIIITVDPSFLWGETFQTHPQYVNIF